MASQTPIAAQPRQSIVDFLSALRDKLKSKIDPEEFNAAIRQARSHSGGVARARVERDRKDQEQKQQDEAKQKAEEETKSEVGTENETSSTDKQTEQKTSTQTEGGGKSGGTELTLRIAAEELENEIREAALYDSPYSGLPFGDDAKHAKMDERVQYREAESATNSCGNCVFFMRSNRCCIVSGIIRPNDTCNLIKPMNIQMSESGMCPNCGKSMSECECDKSPESKKSKAGYKAMSDEIHPSFEPDLKLFFELQEFAEAPEWIPFLPTPGQYSHPRWGTIKMTSERAQKFMKNFRDRVYQGHIPIDLEHSLKVSGAAGYVQDLRQNSDGSVDAKVEWTDLGRDALKKDRFRYFSPEWWDKWNHPTTGATYNDVIVGGALTTRPFFKDSKFGGLRPLIASEGQLYVFSDSLESVEDLRFEDALETFSKFHDSEGDHEMGMTPEEAQRFNELEALVNGQSDQLKAMTERATAAENELASMRAADRVRKFTEVSRDWPGESSKNVQTLVALSETFGEDSDVFKNHVATMDAVAKQINDSKLFHEVGTSRRAEIGPGSDITREIEGKTRQYMEKNPGVSFEVAQAMMFSEEPDLYDKYETSRQVAVKAVR